MKLSELEFGEQFKIKGLTVIQTFLGPDLQWPHKYYYTNPTHMRVHPGYIQSLDDCEVIPTKVDNLNMFRACVVLMLLILLTLLGLSIK